MATGAPPALLGQQGGAAVEPRETPRRFRKVEAAAASASPTRTFQTRNYSRCFGLPDTCQMIPMTTRRMPAQSAISITNEASFNRIQAAISPSPKMMRFRAIAYLPADTGMASPPTRVTRRHRVWVSCRPRRRAGSVRLGPAATRSEHPHVVSTGAASGRRDGPLRRLMKGNPAGAEGASTGRLLAKPPVTGLEGLIVAESYADVVEPVEESDVRPDLRGEGEAGADVDVVGVVLNHKHESVAHYCGDSAKDSA